MRLWGLPPSPLTASLTIFMTSLTEFCVFFYIFFSFQFPTEHRLCLPAWCAFALPRLSPTETPSPSRHSTDSTATPSTGRKTNWKIDCWFLSSQKSSTMFKKFIFPPLFRPYGFGAWGVGSKGFGYNTMVSSPNSFYGGYHYAGWVQFEICLL